MSRDSAEKNHEQTAFGAYIRADYNLEILGQKWRALKHFVLLEIVKFWTRKNNQVSLTIGRILGTIAENTGWL